MVREMGLEELITVHQSLRFALKVGSPVKEPVIKAAKDTADLIKEHEDKKDVIAEKWLKQDDEGNFIPKDSTVEIQFITDYESKDEEAMIKEVEELGDVKYTVNFQDVSANRPVLVTMAEGITKEYPLKEFIELSGSIDSRVAGFINEYFIND